MTYTIGDVLEGLEGVKSTGKDKWQGRCPAHEDNRASLSIGIGDTGKVLLHCHASCSYTDVMKALGLNGKPATRTAKRIVATYHYTDEDGKPLYQTVRYEPKDFRQLRSDGNGSWHWNLRDTRRVLYRLPELLSAEREAPVFVVEGEKDCDRLAGLRLTATTCPMGATKWRTEYNACLKGRNVALLPDLDTPGRKHAAQVAAELSGVADSVKIVELPDIPSSGKDVSDWLNGNHTKDELLGLVQKAEPYKPTEPVAPIAPSLKTLGDVDPEPIRWLWPERMAIGKLTLLAGDPGLGKSFVTLDLAARVSRGDGWPDCQAVTSEPGGVVLLSAEDDLADTIRPRLDAAGADVKRIVAFTSVKRFDADSGEHTEHPFNLAEDLAVLEQAIAKVPGCRLVVIDPISAYLGGTDSHKNAEIRGLLAPLSEIAGRHGVAVVAVTHLRKGEGPAIYRAMGSLAFVVAARAAFCAVYDQEDPSRLRRLVLPIKNNLGNDRTGLAYKLMTVADGMMPSVAWEPAPVELSIDEALHHGADDGEASERREAGDWLRQLLAEGPVEAKAVYTQGGQNGFSRATLRRAKVDLRILSYKEGFSGDTSWLWRLPETTLKTAEDEDSRRCSKVPTPSTLSTFDSLEHLRANTPKDPLKITSSSGRDSEGAQGSECGNLRAGQVPLDPDRPGPLDVLDDSQRKRYLAIHHSRPDGMAPAEKHRRAWRVAVGQ